MSAQPPLIRDQKKVDADHLQLLGIFHFLLAGLALVGLGFLGLHYALMRYFVFNPTVWANQKNSPLPAEFFQIFQWLYVVFGVLLLVGGIANLLSGLWIHARKKRTFSLVVAGIDCIQIPFGTALGVLTIIVLMRDSVRETYAQSAR